MIYSERFHYLFIEVPLTGSWAIHQELREFYEGIPVLHKHAQYWEYARTYPHAHDLFVFATVRNPLDEAVSRYFKLKNDHKRVFSDPKSIEALKIDYADMEKYRFVAEANASFVQFFQRFYRRTYGGFIDISRDQIDQVIRFEDLQEGFSKVLCRLGLDQIRALPVTNKTSGRDTNWESYYTPEIIELAQRVFGPFMQRWGYAYPTTWGDHQVTQREKLEYSVLEYARKTYLTRIRYSDNPYARIVKRLRARLAP